jgi:hypothetical protein
MNFSGPHGGGYLLLALLPFVLIAAAFLLYLVGFGVVVIGNAYEIGKGWLW